MHASGAIASKIGPFLALAFWPASEAPDGRRGRSSGTAC